MFPENKECAELRVVCAGKPRVGQSRQISFVSLSVLDQIYSKDLEMLSTINRLKLPKVKTTRFE